MKDKEKQIEEIETIIKSNLAEGSFANAFARKVAIQIVEHYQPKIPEDSIVISRATWFETQNYKYNLGFNTGKWISRKETAEKILFNFESAFAYYDNEDMFSKKAIFECLEEIVKSCGVEIKE